MTTSVARFEPIELPGLPISVAARPKSEHLAVVCSTGDLIVVDDRTGERVHKLRHEQWTSKPNAGSAQVSYTPDGNSLISLGGGVGATINVRDAGTGQLRLAPLRPALASSNFRSFSISADSRLMATMALGKNEAQVWDLAAGRALSKPLPHPGGQWGLFSVRFSPDGCHLLTGHKDGLDRYWDWQAARLARPPMANHNETHDVAITPDGRFALSVVGGRPELRVCDLTTGRRVAPPVRVGSIEGGWCLSMALTPDGRRAMVCFSEAAVAESNEPRFDLAVVDLEPILSPTTTPTADLALTGGADHGPTYRARRFERPDDGPMARAVEPAART